MVLDALSFLKFSRQKNIISNAREELQDEKRKKNVIYLYNVYLCYDLSSCECSIIHH